MSQQLKASACLLITAMIWGMGFVVKKDCMDTVPPFIFSAVRMWLGAVALIPCILLENRKRQPQPSAAEDSCTGLHNKQRSFVLGGVLCGLAIFFAANCVQVALVTTSASKSGFITALYIVLVPVMGIFLHCRITWKHWTGTLLAAVGLYLLCITGEFTIAIGDLILLLGAFFWGAHVLIVDYYAPRVPIPMLMAVQFIVAGSLSFVVAIFTETIQVSALLGAWPNILYTAVMSSAVAYMFQGIGQKHANPAVASIILSMESLFAAVFGVLFLKESFTERELIGCVLMFIAVIIAQVPDKRTMNQIK